MVKEKKVLLKTSKIEDTVQVLDISPQFIL